MEPPASMHLPVKFSCFGEIWLSRLRCFYDISQFDLFRMVDADVVWQVLLLTTSTAILSTTLVFFVRFPKTRAHPGPVLISLIVSSCLGTLFRAAMFLTAPDELSWVCVGQAPDHHTNTTLVLFWLSLYFLSASTFWYLMLAMDLISSLSNPFLPFQSNSLIHHSLAWPLAGAWCLFYDLTLYNQHRVPTVHLRILAVLPLYAVLLYVVAALRAARAKSRQLDTNAHETTRRMAKLISPYLVVFGATGVILLVVYLAEVGRNAPTVYSLYVDQLTGIIAVIALFVLFYFDSGVGLCRARSQTLPTLASPQPAYTMQNDRVASSDFDVDIAADLRKMIMVLTRMGIVSAAARDPTDLVTGRLPRPEDFSVIERKRITFFGTTPNSMADDLVFEDVAPAVFHSLREFCGIDHKMYLNAFNPDENLKEICSEGRSGNIFYFTANKQFMVKSVPKEEFDVLRSILPAYYNYMLDHRRSFLCRYFGCHSITLPVGTRRMYFVVMANLFHEGPVDQRYDLKGNTDRRQAIATTEVELIMRQTVQRRAVDKLMLDIDFSRIHQCILLADADATATKDQLKRDINFLVDQHIMDYSILVGVRHLHEGAPRQSAAVISRDGTNLYNMGIIDMLQRYNWRWTVQRWFLGSVLCKDTSQVSAVPPVQYGQRLINFIRQDMFNQTRRQSRSSAFSSSTQPSGQYTTTSEGGFPLTHRPSGFEPFAGNEATSEATEMWLATNLSDEISDIDCAILQEN
ncbi:unnamed protein product [Aphanomyces euteiches]